MINERSAAQANTPTSASMQYGYPPNHFDLMNIPQMQNPSDLYSYYPPNLYQPFGTFDDHTQWASADTSGGVPPGPIPFHPQMYNPSPLDMPRNPFDYPPPPHAYPHYHPGFATSTFAGPPSTGTSAFDMSWNPHGLSMQQMQVAAQQHQQQQQQQQQQQMPPIGGSTLNKKPSVYDEYSVSGVGDMLAQHMSSVDLGGGADDSHNYDNGTNDPSSVGVLSANEQHQQQHRHHSSSNNLSLGSSSHPSHQTSSSGGGPKSYASVVSSDTVNANSNNNNKSTPPVSNLSVRSSAQTLSNERHVVNTSGFPNDSPNTRTSASNTSGTGRGGGNNHNNYSQQSRNGNTGGYNSRSHYQSSGGGGGGGGGGVLSWTNSSSPSNSRGNGDTSSNYYSGGSSNYYERSSYSQQQPSSSNSNKRQNSNNYQSQQPQQQQQYYSSRSSHNVSNGSSGAASASAMQQPITAANQEVLDGLKRTHQYNPKDFNLSPKGARFFVIKSYSEDDVHRSIKYNIWCSTEHGNKRLDAAFREREGKGPLYLFFSVNASGHFCGMAEMMSPIDYDHKTDVWHMSNKWQGKFEVKWIYVKDVPNQQFRNIRLENNENKPVTNSRDTQEIPYEKGKLMLKTMHLYRDKTSIFDDFQYYESKQAEEVIKKPNNESNMRIPSGINNKRQTSSTNRPTSTQVEQKQQQDDTGNNDEEEQ